MNSIITLATIDELAEGERIALEIDGQSILLIAHKHQYFCIAEMCTHENISLADGEVDELDAIVCPRHGARFDLRTGKAVCLPATTPVQVYPVTVNGTEIQILWTTPGLAEE